MKSIKLLFATLFTVLFSITLMAQQVSYKAMMNDPQFNFYEVCKTADAYFETHDTGKGSGYKGYQRWKAENESKFYPSGDRSNISQNFYAEQFESFVSKNQIQQRALFPNGWNDLGPYNANNITTGYNPGIGRVESFWVNPSNTQHLFIGSRSGGFWKTTNGGASWENTTDFLIASGVNTITVSPTNTDSVYINVRNGGNGNTHGIYRSINGGETWAVSDFNPSNLGWGGMGANDRIYKIIYHPTVPNLVFVGTNHGLYRSDDNLQTWTQLLSSSDITQIEFHRTNPNIIYLYDDYYWSSFGSQVLISTDLGLSFNPSAVIAGNNDYSGFISTTSAAPNNVYFASTNGIWKSTDEGQNFTFISNPNESCGGFCVSDIDSNAMIYGYLVLHGSLDGGTTFNVIAPWANTSPDSSYIHADLRTSESINGVFYVGTDGYFSKSKNNGATWTRLNDGTGIREFYASGVCQSNYNVYMAGSQDNGTSILNENGWNEWYGADGMEAVVQPLNPDWMIGSIQFGKRNVTKDGGATRQSAGNPDSGSDNASWQAPLLIDPNQQMGVYHFAEKIYKSDEFTDFWYEVGNPSLGKVRVAAIAENNSNIMAASSAAALKITDNGWITNRLASMSLPNEYITDIAFDPKKDSTIIVTYNTYNNDGNKVFLTTDLGFNWTNITYNLQDMPIRSVVIDHSDSSFIYLGAEIGVYVMALNGTSWQLYNPNLPNVTVKDLEIHYGSNTLKAATWGRGLWEYHLKNRADFPAILHTSITNTPTKIFPRAGYDQFVTSVISYDQNIKSAFVRWSNDSKNLDSTLIMSNVSDSTWVTDKAIKNFGEGTDIFFKAFAVGQNNDTTETYCFQYRVRQGININSTEEVVLDNEILIYPNPNFGKFNVKLPANTGAALIEVFDINGKLVFTKTTSNSELKVQINAPAGQYLLSVKTESKEFTQKFVIE